MVTQSHAVRATQPDRAGVRVAAQTIDISPAELYPLGGYIDNPAEELSLNEAERLEANAIVFFDSASRPIVLLTADLLYGGDLGEAVDARSKELGHDIDWIVAASHTHFAPFVDRHLPQLGEYAARYLCDIADRIVALVDQLIVSGRSCDATVAHSARSSLLAVSRRRLWWGADLRARRFGRVATNYWNPSGIVDSRIRLGVVRSLEGSPVCVLWSFACHPVATPHRQRVSAEYPGLVRARLRDRFGPVPVLFFQGCGGDQRPSVLVPTKKPERIRAHIRGRLGLSSAWASPDDVQWRDWCDQLAAETLDLADALGQPDEVASVSIHRSSLSLLDDPLKRSISATRVELSPTLNLALFNAELVAGHVGTINSVDPASWPIGYEGSVVGYWPTTEMLDEGGYEVTGHLPYFGRSELGSTDPTDAIKRLCFAVRSG